jgi:hypothetical protein
VGRHVIGADRRAPRIRPKVRVALDFQHGLGERGEGLAHGHDIASRPGSSVPRPERSALPGALPRPGGQDPQDVGQPRPVLLIGGDDPRFGPPIPTLHGPAVHMVEILKPIPSISGRIGQEGEGPCVHVVHDVREAPLSSLPGPREVPRRQGGILAAACLQILQRHPNGLAILADAVSLRILTPP